jgi:hypothetical protein
MAASELGWAQYDEPRDYANHPSGNEDIGNRAMKQWYAAYSKEHNDDSSHKISGYLVTETGTFPGTDAAHPVSYSNSSLKAVVAFVSRPDTEYPVFRTLGMAGTKEIGTNAFQADQLTDISHVGFLTVGTDPAVNASGVTYDYLILGVE